LGKEVNDGNEYWKAPLVVMNGGADEKRREDKDGYS